MSIANMGAAKAKLSRLIKQIETGAEREIIIARAGKPAARLVALEFVKRKFPMRLGLCEGQYETCSREEFDAVNDQIAAMFGLRE